MKFPLLDYENYDIKYYGYDDLTSGSFIKNVIDHLDFLENNNNVLNDEIRDKEGLYRYLFLLYFKKMVDEIDNCSIDEETVRRIKTLFNSIDYERLSTYFVKYVNSNYKYILSKEGVDEFLWYKYNEELMRLIYQDNMKKISKEVFDYIEKNKPLDILANFSIYSAYYNKHQELLPNLFANLRNSKVFDDEVYCSFLINNRTNNSYLKEQAEFICERGLTYIEHLDLNSDNSNIFTISRKISTYRELAIVYKLLCANKYEEYKVLIDLIKDEFLSKHGQKVNIGPFDSQKVIEVLKSSKGIYKFLYLTHTLKNNHFENVLNSIFDAKPIGLSLDLFNISDIYRSKKYPYYKQEEMELSLILNFDLYLNIFANESLRSEFLEYLVSIIVNVEKHFFRNLIYVQNEVIGSLDLILNIIDLEKSKNTDDPVYKALINGCVMNECGLIEKLIRNILILEIKDKIYLDSYVLSMGRFFAEKKNIPLSDGLMYYLEFYMSTEQNNEIAKLKRPGKDIRNIQMHNQNEKYDKSDLFLCVKLFYFVLSIISDLFVLVIREDTDSKSS